MELNTDSQVEQFTPALRSIRKHHSERVRKSRASTRGFLESRKPNDDKAIVNDVPIAVMRSDSLLKKVSFEH